MKCSISIKKGGSSMRFLKFSLIAGSMLVAAMACAQTPAPPAPPAPPAAGGTPDKIPLDIPYGQSIGIDLAKKVMAATEAEAIKRGWKFNISVVDTNGELVHFVRMEG